VASYPTFGFFAEPPTFEAITAALRDGLAEHLPNCRVDAAEGSGSERVALWNAEDTVEGTPLAGGVLYVTLSDFDVEVYDRLGPRPDEARKKRALAVKLHEVLLGELHAKLTFTSAYDSKFSGEPDHFGRAEQMAAALSAPGKQIADNPGYFWLVGATVGTLAEAPVGFGVALETAGLRLFESREDRARFAARL
jgi:hypothetical protein